MLDEMSLLTVAAAVSCATHGVPCATLPDLPAGQAYTSGVVAEFIPSTVLVIRAHTCLLRCFKTTLKSLVNYTDGSCKIRMSATSAVRRCAHD